MTSDGGKRVSGTVTLNVTFTDSYSDRSWRNTELSEVSRVKGFKSEVDKINPRLSRDCSSITSPTRFRPEKPSLGLFTPRRGAAVFRSKDSAKKPHIVSESQRVYVCDVEHFFWCLSLASKCVIFFECWHSEK